MKSAKSINRSIAIGRLIASGRMMAGLDQSELAALAKCSPSTVSNVERGLDARADTIKSLRLALKKLGVATNHDSSNQYLSIFLTYEEEEDDE